LLSTIRKGYIAKKEIHSQKKGAKKGGHIRRLHRRKEVTQEEQSLICIQINVAALPGHAFAQKKVKVASVGTREQEPDRA
jgi:hypothetical protein